jgi:hypothetical protein
MLQETVDVAERILAGVRLWPFSHTEQAWLRRDFPQAGTTETAGVSQALNVLRIHAGKLLQYLHCQWRM